MRACKAILAVLITFFPMVLLPAQSIDTANQARAILNQALNASGYASRPLPGFTASGTISYYAGVDKQVGTVEIKARGYDQFRMDATMPTGTRTVSFDRSSGRHKEPNGRMLELPAHAMLVAINPLLPYMELANALSRADYSFSYQGTVQEGSHQLHIIRLRRIITKAQDPTGQVEELTQADYFIDGQSLQITRINSTIASNTNINERYPQVIEFENYAGKSAIIVPTTVRLILGGSTAWEVQISNLVASNGLSDADFSVR